MGFGKISKKPRLFPKNNVSVRRNRETPHFQSLPLLTILDTSDPDQENITAEITLRYGEHNFSNKAKTTLSNREQNFQDFSNIFIFGSQAYLKNSEGKIIKKINLDYGLPLIVYRKGKVNKTTFVNQLDITSNFHPHGLNCDTFVDGASMVNVFGPKTQIGRSLTLKYPIINNSMTSAWHPHPMSRSSPLLYGNLAMPYLIKDWLSDRLNPYFRINKNQIPIVFSEIDTDCQGRLNSARLYSYPCINLEVDKAMLQEYPDIDYQEIPNSNLINYCSSLGAWRGTMLQINGQIIDAYTPNVYCQTSDDCADKLFCSSKRCTEQYSQILSHRLTSNLLSLNLVNVTSTFRRSYLGFVDSQDNFLDFWVIGTGNGFTIPWKTKMISLSSMNRNQIMIDFLDYDISELYLVAFDFDITLIEKVIPFQPFKTNPDPKYNRDFFDNFSIFTGCLANRDHSDDNNQTIFNNLECQTIFLELLNKLRSPDHQTQKIPFIRAIKFIYGSDNEGINGPRTRSSDIIEIIKKPLISHPENYYFNYPGQSVAVRKLTMNSGMQFQVDSWFTTWDLPSLKFKFSGDSQYHNLQMLNNIHLTVLEMESNSGVEIKKHHLTFPVTPETDILNIQQLTEIINNKFLQQNLNLQFSYHKRVQNVNGLVNINSVYIRLTNTSRLVKYQIIGNNNIMQFMGVEFKIGSSDITVQDPKKTDISLFLAETENTELVKLQVNPEMPTMGMISVTLPPGEFHEGNPFQVMSDNIMNFSVKLDSSETWIYYNTDNNFFDNHPLHFHLTSGFINKKLTSPINNDNILNGSQDVITIKSGTHLAFNLKFSNFSSLDSPIQNLGYMFHCHYMMHHDMNMMGQFYVIS